jgi:hypothetical protein
MEQLPYVALALGVLSFFVWWWYYLSEAKNPDGHPPPMMFVGALHAFFVATGFVAPKFFLDFVTQSILFYVAVGVSIVVLFALLFTAFVKKR